MGTNATPRMKRKRREVETPLGGLKLFKFGAHVRSKCTCDMEAPTLIPLIVRLVAYI